MNAVFATIAGHFRQAAHSFATVRSSASSCGGYVWSRAMARSSPRVSRSHFDRFMPHASDAPRPTHAREGRNRDAGKANGVIFVGINNDLPVNVGYRTQTSPHALPSGGAVGASPARRLQTPRLFRHPANESRHEARPA